MVHRFLLPALFALTACVATPQGPGAGDRPAADAILVTPLTEPEVAEPVVPETVVVAETPPPAPLPPPDPPMLAQQRAACLREGGQLMARAAGLYACVTPTRDAGRRCDAASDCEGLCLARSGTCAPFQPLYGCQEVFTAPGHRETLCTE